MEKRSQSPPPPSQSLGAGDIEVLMDDFHSGRNSRWPDPLPLLLSSLLRRDLPLSSRTSIPPFLDDFSHLLFPSPSLHLPILLSSLRSLLSDSSTPPSLLLPSLVAATSVFISLDALSLSPRDLQTLLDLLLSLANRPNSSPDRHLRSAACECLRELELAYPCLLSDVCGHLWTLSQMERTHAAQSYMLLLASVVLNAARGGSLGSILSSSVPLSPFTLRYPRQGDAGEGRETSVVGVKEVRKVVAFLVERPQLFTPTATLELVTTLMGIVEAAELRGSVGALLKVQFFGLLYSCDPVLCHVVLMMYSNFSDAFAGDELRVVRQLSGIAREVQQPLVFRLLALHWLLGIAASRPPDRGGLLVPIATSFYPAVYDPLALKAVKLDVLAYISSCIDVRNGGENLKGVDKGVSVVKLLGDGLVCTSSFKWLPANSTETAVTFRMLHKFLIGVAPHLDSKALDTRKLVASTTFQSLQSTLVDLALQYPGLVPVVAAFLDRLMECATHKLVGEWLLQKMDEWMLPKLTPAYRLTRYFPIFERIGKNGTIPPHCLLELLMSYMTFVVKNHGPDTSFRSWSHGSRVLSICRTMLMHHPSSRVFLPLSRLLMFMCQYFPDLEVRDSARFFLRMLLCVPGKKLRHILDFGNSVLGVSPAPHPGSLFQVPSPRPQNAKKATHVSSYMHLERVIPLLVKEPWSLAIVPLLGIENGELASFEGIKDANILDDSIEMAEANGVGCVDRISSQEEPLCVTDSTEVRLAYRDINSTIPTKEPLRITDSMEMHEFRGHADRIHFHKGPLRVTDSRVADILEILRKYFACIPDFRHMPGFKVKIPCTLRFEAEAFSRVWEDELPASSANGFEKLPALYASVIKFSSASKYGCIPACRVPFLLGEPSGADLTIVPLGDESFRKSKFRASVVVELEPREPIPGFVNVNIEASGENGQRISGSLQDIMIGMEDMFLKAHVPSDIPEEYVAEYYLDLFNAMWEACGDPASVGRETFPLNGGKGVAAISGTKSVKLLEVPASYLISSVEQQLAPYIVSVSGSSLIDLVRHRGIIKDVVWKEDFWDPSGNDNNALVPYSSGTPLQLTYYEEQNDADNSMHSKKMDMGCFLVLIFLPPRYHLLLQMEVCHLSTLVRIRTDHWPSLAYVDEYLEALFFRQ